MAIKTESLSKLLVKLKIAPDEAAAKELITGADQKDVALVDGMQVFTKEELDTRDNANKSTSIKAGTEISIKDLKELVGLTYDGEGSKDPKKFTEEFRKKVLADANISTDEKIKEHEKTITKLRENLKASDLEKADNIQKAKVAQLDYSLLKDTHDLKPDNLEDNEWITILKMNNELVEENGGLFVKRGGEIVKDPKLQTPIPAKDALRAYITERKLGKDLTAAAAAGAGAGDGGRGAGDSKGTTSGITKMSQFNKHLEDNKINALSMEAQTMLTKLSSANKDFDFNS